MQSLIKTCALPIVLLSLTACGGGGSGGSKPASSSPASSAPVSSEAASSVAPSSTPASSVAPSSTPASSVAPSSSSAALSSNAASSVAASNESTQTAVNYTDYSIAKIDNCGVGIAAVDKTFNVFADYDGGVQNQSLSSLSFYNWNHAGTTNTPPIPNEWANLIYAPSTYNVPNSAAVNSSCSDVDTINVVLVKKVANWHRQHSNGFGRTITSFGQKFGTIKELVFDVKVNSAKTKTYTPAELKALYSSYLSDASVVDTMDAGKVNLGITLETSNNFRAAIAIEIDQSLYADQWVRVTIPMSSLHYYEDINYQSSPRDASLFADLVINNVLIVGETRSKAVLRSDIAGWTDTSPTPPPEYFKEMNISFKKIELQLK